MQHFKEELSNHALNRNNIWMCLQTIEDAAALISTKVKVSSHQFDINSWYIWKDWGFPGGPVAEATSQCRNIGLICSRKIPHAAEHLSQVPQLLSLCSRAQKLHCWAPVLQPLKPIPSTKEIKTQNLKFFQIITGSFPFLNDWGVLKASAELHLSQSQSVHLTRTHSWCLTLNNKTKHLTSLTT